MGTLDNEMDKGVELVITRFPRWSYFQWFLLGFYQLREKGHIKKISFQTDWASRISLFTNNRYLLSFVRRFLGAGDSYNLEGYIKIKGAKKYFCIDSADAPYLFDSEKLKRVDVYFKMQCPLSLALEGFYLTDNIIIPWCDHEHVDVNLKHLTDRGERKSCASFQKNTHKIKPLMVGPRHLSRGNSFRALSGAYRNYLLSSHNQSDKKMMCYFGNALGPRSAENIDRPDFDNEGDIVGWFGEKINHPNEKRAKAVEIMEQLGDRYDARLISKEQSDGNSNFVNKNIVVPLSKFCDHISRFEYNLNISGYRMSIPNRFLESFMAGTAIVTDRLRVQWYKPFETEVKETVEMGYLPDNKVDWDTFRNNLIHLPVMKKAEVMERFYENWAPEMVAKYIIETVIRY